MKGFVHLGDGERHLGQYRADFSIASAEPRLNLYLTLTDTQREARAGASPLLERNRPWFEASPDGSAFSGAQPKPEAVQPRG